MPVARISGLPSRDVDRYQDRYSSAAGSAVCATEVVRRASKAATVEDKPLPAPAPAESWQLDAGGGDALAVDDLEAEVAHLERRLADRAAAVGARSIVGAHCPAEYAAEGEAVYARWLDAEHSRLEVRSAAEAEERAAEEARQARQHVYHWLRAFIGTDLLDRVEDDAAAAAAQRAADAEAALLRINDDEAHRRELRRREQSEAAAERQRQREEAMLQSADPEITKLRIATRDRLRAAGEAEDLGMVEELRRLEQRVAHLSRPTGASAPPKVRDVVRPLTSDELRFYEEHVRARRDADGQATADVVSHARTVAGKRPATPPHVRARRDEAEITALEIRLDQYGLASDAAARLPPPPPQETPSMGSLHDAPSADDASAVSGGHTVGPVSTATCAEVDIDGDVVPDDSASVRGVRLRLLAHDSAAADRAMRQLVDAEAERAAERAREHEAATEAHRRRVAAPSDAPSESSAASVALQRAVHGRAPPVDPASSDFITGVHLD